MRGVAGNGPRRSGIFPHGHKDRPADLGMRRTAGLFLAACIFVAIISEAHAQEIEPRAYANAPVGVNFFIAGYAYTKDGLAFNQSLPLNNPQLDTHSAVLACARVLDLRGKSAKIDAIAPYTFLDGTAEYDHDKVVNIGTNRWSFKPELAISKAVGQWTLEGAAAATFYTDNDDFFGGRTRSQDPIYSFQGHAIYSFPKGIWASFDATCFTGGRTTLDDARNSDLQQNWRVGGTLAFPVNRRNSVKLRFEDLETLLQTLTPERWMLLKILRKKGPTNVHALARELKREYKKVYEDSRTLERIGLIERMGDDEIAVPWDIVEASLHLAA